MSDAVPLPSRPNLEQYKKLARDLQDACKSGDPGAIRQWATQWLENLTRLEGAANAAAHRDGQNRSTQIEQHWNRLRENNENIAKCTLTGTQFFIAREHGFKSWPTFARHVQELARANSSVSAFEAAADAIVSGDIESLRQLLVKHPGLARERSSREHRSTLLHYVSANGVEDYRQKTPKNIVEITKLLLDAGAAVDAESDAYGGGCTTLGLVATSVHPEKAGVQIELLRTLIDRGARLDHPSAGGNHHTIVPGCLHNGQPEAARFLADLGAPLDLESAAGVGRLEDLRKYFEGETRPDRKDAESALLYAAGYGRAGVVEYLLDQGVDPASRNGEGQTALHWACWGPHVDVIRLLIERGSPVDAIEKSYHAMPIDMAVWTWGNAEDKGDRDRCYEAVGVLVRAGAHFRREHWEGPRGSGILGEIDRDPRMLAALGGE